MNTILAPIDFSRVSRAVISEAVRLAGLLKGRVVLVHVVQPVQLPVAATNYGAIFDNISEYTEVAGRYADRRLAKLRASLRSKGVRVDAVRLAGYPAACILEQAKKRKASYVVVGTHGHTAFYDLLVGSTTSGILKRAGCPVVVVPTKRRPRRGTRR